jgi:hypothetical protein
MASSGITQKIQVLKETSYGDGGAAGEKVFGATKSFEWREDTATVQTYDLESGLATPNKNVDGVRIITGSHEWALTDGHEFEAILGTISGTTSFTLSEALTVPSYGVKVVDGDGFRIIKGLKYGKFALAIARDEIVTIKAEWTAKSIEETTTFTPTLTTTEPLTFMDGYVKLGTTAQTDIEAFSVEISRVLSPRRFIESTSAGSRRNISAIIEGKRTTTFSGTQGAKTDLIKEIYGGATPADTRADKTIQLIFARTGSSALTLNLTGSRYTTLGRTMSKDDEVAVGEFGGVCLTVSGSGTYPN